MISPGTKEIDMIPESLRKQALQVTKEVVIKFIEVGRISPATFGENFDAIYRDVLASVVENGGADSEDGD